MEQMKNPDVIVIGSGGGGAVIAKELGERGIRFSSSMPGHGTGTRNGRSQTSIAVWPRKAPTRKIWTGRFIAINSPDWRRT